MPELGVVAYTYDARAWEAEAGGLQVQCQHNNQKKKVVRREERCWLLVLSAVKSTSANV
jgi:hypothetical protein